ncbi:DUF6270 domain-containing protein [Ornithinimicrobium sp. Y1694]|uniref:DUF6270 domain-containing protein n=1 Tax=Ornithinimicrobium sp. Y1694 TaxID=3418590 RepID=UPI003CE77378
MRTFVYGSCISRDSFEYLDPNHFELHGYVARQSLLSAMAAPTSAPIPPIKTTSPFQSRMLYGDWASSLLPRLGDAADNLDLIIWDLCDERLGIRTLDTFSPQQGKPIATRSVDAIRSGLDEALAKTPLISFGTRRHRLLFLRSLKHFTQFLVATRLHSKTVVLAPDWAGLDDANQTTPASFGLTAERANRIYTDYYRAIELVSKLPIVRLREPHIRADAGHMWGPAPFHYTPETYTRIAKLLVREVDHISRHSSRARRVKA